MARHALCLGAAAVGAEGGGGGYEDGVLGGHGFGIGLWVGCGFWLGFWLVSCCCLVIGLFSTSEEVGDTLATDFILYGGHGMRTKESSSTSYPVPH